MQYRYGSGSEIDGMASGRVGDMLKNIHHINFMVRDLDAAVACYSAAFDAEFLPRERLEERGVDLQRFRAGESWIVLVSPYRDDSAPGRWLAEHGEGLFLVSFAVDSLEAALTRLDSVGHGVAGAARAGLDDWRVLDLIPEEFGGVPLQLTESGGAAGARG